MDPSYKPLYQQAQRLEHQIKDAADDPNHPTVRSLQGGLRALMDDMEAGKNPRSIEGRVKTLQQQLSQLRAQGDQAMDYGHIDEFNRSFEAIRQDIRQLPNY